MSEQLTAETAVAISTSSAGSRARSLLTDPGAIFGILILGIVLIGALGADILAPYSPTGQDLEFRRAGPSAEHLLGSDGLGRDILSRLMFGARATLFGSALAVSISLAVGVPLGLYAGFRGGWIEASIMRSMDVLLAFPSFLLAIVIVAILEPNLQNAAIAIGVAGIPAFARLVRGSVLSVRSRDYMLAAVGSGAGDMRLMLRYVLPNVFVPILVLGTLSMGTAVLSIAGLSFLGLGAQPPAPEWGSMLRDGRDYLREAPHITLWPGAAIMMLVLALNLLGDAVQEQLNPQSQRRLTRGKLLEAAYE
jgi:peptide/nickel transport system permease protein